MKILIVDDTPEVLDNFAKAIVKLGHTPISCKTLREACRTIEDPGTHIDIAFIDNHFANEGFGIDKVGLFRTQKPEMDIVVTTKRDVRPDLVAEIVNLEVGFFKKQTDDPTLLEAEISQRVNMRRAEEQALRRKFAELKKVAGQAHEGIRRLLGFVTGGERERKLLLESIEATNQKAIVPRFERFLTIQVGQQVEITQEFEFECAEQWKAATTLGLGLGIDESLKFFKSKLGLMIKGRIQSEFTIDETARLKGSYRVGQKLCLTEDDERRQIRRREYYRGIEHSIYRAIIRSSCSRCGARDVIELRVFVPAAVVEVSVAFDKQGFKVPGEDGREAYHQVVH
jgi:hypothetical protein